MRKILFAVVFTILMSVPVLAPELPGHVFYGSVNINGNQAPDGTIVTAKIDGTEVKSTTVPSPDENYDYVLIIPEQYLGDTVQFYVNGIDTGKTGTVLQGGHDLIDLSITTNEGGSGGGGGGGGGGNGETTSTIKQETTQQEDICREKWTCTEWSACVNGRQTRTCTEQNGCGTDLYKPFEEQPCVSEGGTQAGGFDFGSTGRFLTSPVGIGSIAAIVVAIALVIFWKKKGFSFPKKAEK